MLNVLNDKYQIIWINKDVYIYIYTDIFLHMFFVKYDDVYYVNI